ncbi:MAG: hypothetical protein PHD95_03265 [Candidatus ainarchaeum sp.]|nr:hypothetical protein [Candidatus ainarchaeum sp.]
MELTTTATSIIPQQVQRRVSYFGLQRQKHCMNCGRLIMEEADLYSRRFCSTSCKEEYCSPIKHLVKQV